MSVQSLEKVRDEIHSRREGAKTLPGLLQEGRKRLRHAPPPIRKEHPRSPLESAVLSRNPAIDLEDNRGSEEEQEMERESLGENVKQLIHQLYVSLGSIKSCNTSNQAHSLLDKLHENSIINKKTKRINNQRLYKAMTDDDHPATGFQPCKTAKRNSSNKKPHDFTIYFEPPHLFRSDKKLQSGVEQTDYHELFLVQVWENLHQQQQQQQATVEKKSGHAENFDFFLTECTIMRI